MSFLCNSLLAIMFKCVEPGFSFKSPPNILIVGPTRCAKTTFLHHLLLENSRFLFSHLHSKRYKKGNENSLFPHRKSIARSWKDSKNLITGDLGKREVTTRIKRLKMTKPQSRGKAKGGARTAQEHIRSGNTFYLTLPRNDGSLKCFPDNKNNS